MKLGLKSGLQVLFTGAPSGFVPRQSEEGRGARWSGCPAGASDISGAPPTEVPLTGPLLVPHLGPEQKAVFKE